MFVNYIHFILAYDLWPTAFQTSTLARIQARDLGTFDAASSLSLVLPVHVARSTLPSLKTGKLDDRQVLYFTF